MEVRAVIMVLAEMCASRILFNRCVYSCCVSRFRAMVVIGVMDLRNDLTKNIRHINNERHREELMSQETFNKLVGVAFIVVVCLVGVLWWIVEEKKSDG